MRTMAQVHCQQSASSIAGNSRAGSHSKSMLGRIVQGWGHLGPIRLSLHHAFSKYLCKCKRTIAAALQMVQGLEVETKLVAQVAHNYGSKTGPG